MSNQEIVSKLKELFIDMLRIPENIANTIEGDTDLIHEIGMNSIDALEFLVIVEREFSIMIDDEDLTAELIQTLNNLSNYILQKVA
ncbi:acyl carrier protein [Bacillus cereus]|uniref:acyl carrier protein n=1 Tax=Bacillus cereus TaxID=1396 RepID=UPI00069E45AC|nr:phosphopantetheine-binding protein [Bacillus cereus]